MSLESKQSDSTTFTKQKARRERTRVKTKPKLLSNSLVPSLWLELARPSNQILHYLVHLRHRSHRPQPPTNVLHPSNTTRSSLPNFLLQPFSNSNQTILCSLPCRSRVTGRDTLGCCASEETNASQVLTGMSVREMSTRVEEEGLE